VVKSEQQQQQQQTEDWSLELVQEQTFLITLLNFARAFPK
jgi:hypothetical protein